MQEASSLILSSFNNKDAYSCLTGEHEYLSHAAPTPPANSFIQDHMVFDHGSSTVEDFSFSMPSAAFINSKEDDGMTRDFLSLRPLSNSHILDVPNLHPNYINPKNSTSL